MSQDQPHGDADQQPPQYAPPLGGTPPQGAPQYAAPSYDAPQPGAWPASAPPVVSQTYYVPYPVPAQAPATNTLSILALIAAFLAPFVVPVVLGHISLNQIRRTGEGGRGLAIAALVLGYIQVALWGLLICFIVWVGVVAAASS